MTVNAIMVITGSLIGYSFAENKAYATIPLAVMTLSVMFTTIPISLFMKKHGRRIGFWLGAVFGLIGTSIAGYAIFMKSFLLYCVGLSFVGMFHGTSVFFRFAATEIASDEFKNRAISYVVAGGIISALIAAPIARYTRDLFEPYYFIGCYLAAFCLVLSVSFIVSFVNFPKNKQIKSNKKAEEGRSLLEIASQPTFIVAVSASVIGYGIMILVMTSTPLAMEACSFTFSDITKVIQWHALGMYVPSLFTGKLIDRFGKVTIILTGTCMFAACAVTGYYGTDYMNFWLALFLLGVGWNFMFVGGTSLLTETYTEEEKAKIQGVNDFVIFGVVSFTTLLSGWLLHNFGWQAVNLGVLPFISFILIVSSWLKIKRLRKAR